MKISAVDINGRIKEYDGGIMYGIFEAAKSH